MYQPEPQTRRRPNTTTLSEIINIDNRLIGGCSIGVGATAGKIVGFITGVLVDQESGQ